MKERVTAFLANTNLHKARLREVSEAVGLAPTTIRKRLQSEGVRFSDLLDSERKRRCDRLLGKCPIPTGDQIAEVTGYWDKESARKAFTRWYGASPINRAL